MGLGEPRHSSKTAQHGKQRLPPRQGLMHIALMTHIKNKAILRRIKHAMDRHGQFHRAKIRRQMSSGFRYRIQQKSAQFFT